MTKEEIGLILKGLRTSCGMTQKEVAETLGRKQQIIGHWETGYAQPDANTLFLLCDIYGTTVDEAFGFSRKENFSKTEVNIIKKYRFISEHSPDGTSVIDTVLDREYSIAEKLQKQKDRIAELEASPATIIELPPRPGSRHLTEYFHDASAGGGIFILGNEAASQIVISDSDWDERTDFVIRVNGDSMNPDYMDGDNVMVSQRVEMFHGDVGIFVVNGKAYIKEYGETELISRNPDFPNIPIHVHDNIVCMGKVIGKLEREYEIISG